MAGPVHFLEARQAFHAELLHSTLAIDENGVPSNADSGQKASVRIATGIAKLLEAETHARLAGQTSGDNFETACASFLKATFLKLGHLRPGQWDVKKVGNRNREEISKYDQYAHLIVLERLAKDNPELAAALGSDYTITPDVILIRSPEDDAVINAHGRLVDTHVAKHTSLRRVNEGQDLLHASISCKWTLRSDRAQNARSEALNLIRNRKGRLPHVVVVTAEPTPSRLASIALGTGDIDCVYHFALYELQETLKKLEMEDAEDLLSTMVDGKRLKDISDLPLDLAI